MNRMSVVLVLLLLGSNMAGLFVHLCARARWRRYNEMLRRRLRRKHEGIAAQLPDQHLSITSDYMLVRHFGNQPVRHSQPLQVWLLQPRKMCVDTEAESVWVDVTRVGDNIKLTGAVHEMRLSCYGATFNQACENFSQQVSARNARTMRQV